MSMVTLLDICKRDLIVRRMYLHGSKRFLIDYHINGKAGNSNWRQMDQEQLTMLPSFRVKVPEENVLDTGRKINKNAHEKKWY